MSKRFRITLLAAALSAALMTTAHAHSEASELSALSLLPAAVSVAAPSMLIAGGAVLTVVSVQASATGTVWVLERASDGAREHDDLRAGGVELARCGFGEREAALHIGHALRRVFAGAAGVGGGPHKAHQQEQCAARVQLPATEPASPVRRRTAPLGGSERKRAWGSHAYRVMRSL